MAIEVKYLNGRISLWAIAMDTNSLSKLPLKDCCPMLWLQASPCGSGISNFRSGRQMPYYQSREFKIVYTQSSHNYLLSWLPDRSGWKSIAVGWCKRVERHEKLELPHNSSLPWHTLPKCMFNYSACCVNTAVLKIYATWKRWPGWWVP